MSSASVLALVLVAACGGDDDAGSAVSGPQQTAVTEPTTAAVELEEVPEDQLTVECLAPQPLAERTTISYGTSARIEFYSTPMLADVAGELDAENIDLTVEILPPSDNKQVVGAGDLDVAGSGLDQSYLNMVAADAPVKLVLPGNRPNDNSGLVMARTDIFTDPDNPDIAELEGATVAIPGGKSTGSAWAINGILSQGGLGIDDVEVIELPVPDLFTALETGASDFSFLFPPFLGEAQRSGNYVSLGGFPPDYALVGYIVGPSLMEGDPAITTAFVRALLRTQLKYLQGDYYSNPDTVELLAQAMEVDPASLADGGELNYSYNFHEDMFEDTQDYFLTQPGLSYTDKLPFEDLIDRSYLLAATEPCRN